MRAARRVDATVGWVRMDVATVPPLRSPTRLTAARKKKSGCSGRDDKSGKGDSQESSRRVARRSAPSFLRGVSCSNEQTFPAPQSQRHGGCPSFRPAPSASREGFWYLGRGVVGMTNAKSKKLASRPGRDRFQLALHGRFRRTEKGGALRVSVPSPDK